MESLLRHEFELKRVCTLAEWMEFNNSSKRREQDTMMFDMTLFKRFWKKLQYGCAVMKLLVKVLEVID